MGRVLLQLVVVLCFGIFVASCSQPPAEPLRVATNVWTGYEPLYLARSLGLYDGNSIHLVEMTSSSEVSRALSNRRVEAAALTLDEVLNLRQTGLDLRVVLVMDVSSGADVLVARKGIEHLPDLRGKRIGVENGAVGAVMLDAALEAAKLRADDIHLVPLNANEHLPAWRKGTVDALVTFEPVSSQLLQEGGQVLFDSSQIPGRILDVLVVRADVLDRHADALRMLLAGHFSALRYMRTEPEDAAIRMAPRLGVDAALVSQQFLGLVLPDLAANRRWLAGASPRIENAAQDLQQLMLERKLLQREVKTTNLAVPNFLPGESR